MLLSVEDETINEEARKGLRSIRYTTLILWHAPLLCGLRGLAFLVCSERSDNGVALTLVDGEVHVIVLFRGHPMSCQC